MATSHSNVRYVPIKGFPGYCIGDDGSIWSTRQSRGNEWRKLKPRRQPNNYLSIVLCRPPVMTVRLIHQLVLEHFVSPRPEGMDACHNDGSRTNNRLENLRWDTRKGNFADKIKHGTHNKGENHQQAKLTEKQVVVIWQRLKTGKKGIGVTLAKEYNVGTKTISDIKLKRTWSHVTASFS